MRDYSLKETAAAGIIMLAVIVMAVVPGYWRMMCGDVRQAGKQAPAAGGGNHTFSYISSATGRDTQGGEFYYNDSFFDADNSVYDDELAIASLAMAMAGFTYENVERLLGELKYENIEGYRYDVTTDEDKVAAAFACKGDIITICIRGGRYGDEWGSNGRLGGKSGETGFHYGFHTAAEDLLKQLASYAAEQNIELSAARIWLTGFSRGAAVANVLGAKLQEYGVVEADDLYCYTFATPNTASQAALGTAEYRGIFNVVDPLDLVTRLPMGVSGESRLKSGRVVKYSWDYVRYGETMELEGDDADRQVIDLLEKSLAFATRDPERYAEKFQDDVIIPLLKEYMGSDAGKAERRSVIRVITEELPGMTSFMMRELNGLDFKAQLYIGNMISGAEEKRLQEYHSPENYWNKITETDMKQ